MAHSTPKLNKDRSFFRQGFKKILSVVTSFPGKPLPRRPEILEKAHRTGGFIEVTLPDEVIAAYPELGGVGSLQIPRAPFENWALWRTDGHHLATPWKAISKPNMKMFGDDPFHTDWMIGAGLPLDAFRDRPGRPNAAVEALRHAIDNLHHEIQHEKLDFRCAVLCGKGAVTGHVVHPKPGEQVDSSAIAVISEAGPDYMATAFSAAGIITERGGTMAHLVVMARPAGVPIVRVKQALQLYPEGSEVTLDLSRGEVDLLPGRCKSQFTDTPPWEIDEPEPASGPALARAVPGRG